MKMEMEMTLDEAILHCEEVADCCDNRECANEHRQLAEWLKELKERKASELSSANLQPNLQQTCNLASNDCISRQDAIDALKNRWKKTRNYEGNGDDIAEECELYLKQVPPAQPDVPDTNVGDLISREAMGDALNRMRVGNNETWYSFYQKVLNELCKLPSVQPEDCDTCKHGYFGDGKCDNCRVRFPSHYERRADEGN